MIAQIKGILVELNPTYAILDCLGIGYELFISISTYSSIRDKKEVLLYTRQIIRDDAHLLYGFYFQTERKLFNYLISVNGVGPSSAIMILSSLSISEITEAIISGNSSILKQVKGIGSKTAQRIIIDLHDEINTFIQREKIYSDSDKKIKTETLNALEVLGINRKISERYADEILKNFPNITVEELIKQILKNRL